MLKDHDTALGKFLGDRIQIVEKKSKLSFGEPVDSTPEEDDRRLRSA
jgi:hypothetical protein